MSVRYQPLYKNKPRKKPVRRPEQVLVQKPVAAYLHAVLTPEVWWAHVPNERKCTPLEGMELRLQGVKAGVPDIIIVWRGMAYWIEVKTEAMPVIGVLRSYLSPEQKNCHRDLRAAGCEHIAVCRSVDEVRQQLRAWGIPTREAT